MLRATYTTSTSSNAIVCCTGMQSWRARTTIAMVLLVALVATGCGSTRTVTGTHTVAKRVITPNPVAVKPPSDLTASQKATFVAGEGVAEQSGCEACHLIGNNGNNGPGPPLTHIGSARGPAGISAALRNPTAPMPSFSGLAQTSPKKFRDLVEFLALLK